MKLITSSAAGPSLHPIGRFYVLCCARSRYTGPAVLAEVLVVGSSAWSWYLALGRSHGNDQVGYRRQLGLVLKEVVRCPRSNPDCSDLAGILTALPSSVW
jgi:hypothetical protein